MAEISLAPNEIRERLVRALREIDETIRFFELKSELIRHGLDADIYDELEQMEDKAHIYYQNAIKALKGE